MSGRRTSLTTTSRRRSSGVAPRLGAVKLQSPLGAGAGSDAGSPMSGSEPSSALATPQEQSPLVAAARSTAANIDSGHISTAAVDGVKQFSRKLSADRSADKWLEEQSTASAAAAKGAPQRQRPLASASQQQHKAAAVETAASQIVHKALGFITADAPRRASAPAVAGTGTAAGAVAARKASSNFDSSSFLDKGMDAISGVGRLMEGFVSQLDTVIGQAFEDWGTNPRPGAKPLPRRPLAASAAVAGKENAGVPAAAAVPAAAGVAGAAAKPRQEQQVPPQQQQQQGGASNSGSRQPHITSFMSKLDAASEQEAVEWRKRAQQMAQELQRMRAQQEEYQRLRLQYEKLQTDLQQTSTQASRLAQENSTLKSRGLPPGADPSLADPMAEQQVARQMEALLTEKSKLVAENDRLLRENTGLQELLEFSLAHQSQLTADGDLFGYGDDECGDEGLAAAVEEEALAVAAACSPSPAAEGATLATLSANA